jgi:hypothetical protein
MRLAGAGMAAVLALVVVLDSSGGPGNNDGGDQMERAAMDFSVEMDSVGGGEDDSGDGSVAGAPDAPSNNVQEQDAGGGARPAATQADQLPTSPEEQYSMNADETAAPEAATVTSSEDGDGGVSAILVIEIALAVLAIGAIAGSFVVSRLRREPA